jgi:hypothetical protein
LGSNTKLEELAEMCSWSNDDDDETYRVSRCHDLGFKTLLASDSSEYTALPVEVIYSGSKYEPGIKYSKLAEGVHNIKLQPYNKDSGATFGSSVWDDGSTSRSTTNDFTITI